MALLNILSTFVDFKNTKESKKLDIDDSELILKFTKVKRTSGKGFDIRISLNKDLVEDMKKNGILHFKFMYDEKSYNVAIVYCTLKDAYNFEGRKARPSGNIELLDKYVTATLLKLFEEKNAMSIKYKGRFIKDQSAYLFTMGKINKRSD